MSQLESAANPAIGQDSLAPIPGLLSDILHQVEDPSRLWCHL